MKGWGKGRYALIDPSEDVKNDIVCEFRIDVPEFLETS